jgi:hypothetical protein
MDYNRGEVEYNEKEKTQNKAYEINFKQDEKPKQKTQEICQWSNPDKLELRKSPK